MSLFDLPLDELAELICIHASQEGDQCSPRYSYLVAEFHRWQSSLPDGFVDGGLTYAEELRHFLDREDRLVW